VVLVFKINSSWTWNDCQSYRFAQCGLVWKEPRSCAPVLALCESGVG